MRSLATFRLISESGGSAAAVTARLGIAPSKSDESGEPRGRSGAVWDLSGWHLSSSQGPENGTELADHLKRLLDILEPLRDELWSLTSEGYWPNWFCYLGSRATEHAAELDRDTITRLLALPGDLWIDVYPEDEGDEE